MRREVVTSNELPPDLEIVLRKLKRNHYVEVGVSEDEGSIYVLYYPLVGNSRQKRAEVIWRITP